MSTDSRPLSPHLQIYKMPMAGLMSITHRITGIFLSIGTITLGLFFIAAAGGPESFAAAQACALSIVGRLLMFGWLVAFYYHLGNGVRHLFWDAGKALDMPSVNRSGIANLIWTAFATVVTLIVVAL